MNRTTRIGATGGTAWLLAALAACGGGGGGGSGGGGDSTHAVGGTVAGLAGSGLQLQNNGTDTLSVAASGAFAFATREAGGSAYAVTVSQQPVGQVCTVAGGAGTVGTTDVTGIAVTCKDTALAVQSVSPADQAASVARDGTIVATFNRAIDDGSITAQSVRLAGPEGNALATTSQVSNAQLTLAPAALALPGDTTWTLTLGTGLRDVDGNALAAPFTSSFTTAPSAWGTSTATVATMNVYQPDLSPNAAVVTPGGAVSAFWWHDQIDLTRLDAATFSPSTNTWSHAATLRTSIAFAEILSVNAVADPHGRVTLAWLEALANMTTVVAWYATYDPSTGSLSTPAPLPIAVPGRDVPQNLRLVADASGDMMALAPAVTVATATPELLATHFDAVAGAWSEPVALPLSGTAAGVGPPALASDGQGGFVAAWLDQTPTAGQVDVSAWSPTTHAWRTPQALTQDVRLGALVPVKLVTDPSGWATVAWTDGGTGSESVEAARRDPVSGRWSAAQRVDRAPAGQDAYTPGLTVDAAGDVTVAWLESTGTHAARFDIVTKAWSSPVLVSGTRTTDPQLVADDAGNVTVLALASSLVEAARYRATDHTWHAPVTIDGAGSDALIDELPLPVVDATGTVTVLWFSVLANAGVALVSNRLQ